VVDAGRSFGSGVIRGGLGVLGLPGTVETLGRAGINFAGRQFGAGGNIVNPKSTFPTGGDYQKDLEGAIGGPLYKPRTTVGEYARTAGEFLPGMAFPAGRAGTMAERAIYNVAAPALASQTAGQLTKGTEAEPYARVAGALVGGQLPQAAGRIVSPLNIDPTRARMGQVLENEGIGLTAGDRTGSRFVRWMESNAADTPLSGNRAQAIKEAQSEQFTRAALQRAGIDADRATPEVIDHGFRRLGQEFEAMARLPRFVVPKNAMRWVDQAVQQYERVTPQQFLNPAPRAIAEEMRAMLNARANAAGRTGVQRAMIPGDVFQKWMSDLGAAARGAQDPSTRRLLGNIRNTLDDAAEQSMRAINPNLADQYRIARTQYRNLLAIERAVTGAGENAALGLISPSQLRNAIVQMQGRRSYARGQGDFADLARAGESLLKPLPQSGTNPRMMASAAGAALGSATFGIPGGAAGALAPAAGQAVIGRAVMSRPMQAYLANQLLAGTRALPRGNPYAALMTSGSVPGALTPQEIVVPMGDLYQSR
jgi:hypothetical protein